MHLAETPKTSPRETLGRIAALAAAQCHETATIGDDLASMTIDLAAGIATPIALDDLEMMLIRHLDATARRLQAAAIA
ncbi:hypothetical protein EYW49_03915 [Siculibacillus lacustris]|uniref:Uncharacterized protein n=1 Tax=Siculibacillus lacustris TaxID=1549641 RepID=A0A4Q9VY66_9HYPH|nr:hypothetical protein [Siculibacillus lacustris]TBW40338.1 hypothetical protein EYW49_03915 [Siculibacillus lacustris]